MKCVGLALAGLAWNGKPWPNLSPSLWPALAIPTCPLAQRLKAMARSINFGCTWQLLDIRNKTKHYTSGWLWDTSGTP